jgi:YVTN family beta-propeller protein
MQPPARSGPLRRPGGAMPGAPGGITIPAPLIAAGGTATYTVAATAGVTYSWNFGDGSPATPFSATPRPPRCSPTPASTASRSPPRDARRHQHPQLPAGRAHAATPAGPTPSSPWRWRPAQRLGAPVGANPDNDTVSVIDTATNARVAEIAVGRSPRSVARRQRRPHLGQQQGLGHDQHRQPGHAGRGADGGACRGLAPAWPGLRARWQRLRGAGGTGRLLKLDPAAARQGTLALGPNVRHLALSGDGATALVSRFITPPLPGEGTANVNTATAGGEVLVVDPAR